MKICTKDRRNWFNFLQLIFLCAAGAIIFPLPAAGANLLHHELKVSLDPASHRLAVTDTVTLPGNMKQLRFLLHTGLNPSSTDPGVQISKEGPQAGGIPGEAFTLKAPAGKNTVTIRYQGDIYHPLESSGKNQARGFDHTAGSIADEGVYLAGSSAWYPVFETELVTFTLNVDLPAGWDAVSQGSRTVYEKTKDFTKIRWISPQPQEEIYLVASRFSAYEKRSGDFIAMVFLRKPDKALAEKYLEATIRYVGMYDKLIGPYPYEKFALVENFWETGFGMPSFTLLGSTVLRLPFIINTSYPHEILHTWWGNGVYPVYGKGNWSEGLTAYLADHLLKEQQGAGAEYRLTTLQKYADYVFSSRDFPLTEFTSRHSASTEAVGYGKALMFFHMLRLELGDEAFIAAVRDFYRTYTFRLAGFDELEKSFESASGKNLKIEFEQWVTRAGAPELRLEDVVSRNEGRGTKDDGKQQGSYTITARLQQTQPGKAYKLNIPVAVTMEGHEKAFQTIISMNEKEQEAVLTVPSRPLRIDIDPEFDIFRRLDKDEIPPAISQALGANKMLIVLPASADKELLSAYKALAEILAESGPDETEVKFDNEVKNLPADRAVAILGWENSLLQEALPAWSGYEVGFTGKNVKIGKNEIPRENHDVVLTARNPRSKDMGLMFIGADHARSVPGLGRKLPHYHKYSYLAFEGDEPSNVAKGRWPVVDSPLTAFFQKNDPNTPRVEMGKLSPRKALISLPRVYSEERMMETVKYLSSDALKGRKIGTPEIDKAAEYIAAEFKEAGLVAGGENGSYYQTWTDSARKITMKNVIGFIPGRKPELEQQSVVVGAHFDHLGLGETIGRKEDKGIVHPGADDNASGAAVLLELAKVMKENHEPDRSVVFAAFTGEEEGKLGSRYYVATEKKYPVSKCIGMVNLDTVGRLGKKKLLVFGGGSAKEWVHIFRGAGFATGVEVEMVSEELDTSDQKSFQEAGVPAVQLFSGAHLDYHRPTDTAEKIDAEGLAKVAAVAKEVVEYLAGRDRPLSSTLKAGKAGQTASKTERKVSFGTIPDFSFRGEGFRLSDVVEGSPAETAGLKSGDVIIQVNSLPVTGLNDFSDILKKLKPGQRISITFVRDGRQSTVQARVKNR